MATDTKIFFDTSVLVAAMVKPHPEHTRAFPWLKGAKAKEVDMLVASHTLAELSVVLTALALRPKISPVMARGLIGSNMEVAAKIIMLTLADYKSSLIESNIEI